MQLLDDRLLLSASDLINFLECERLTALDLEAAYGRLTAEPKRPDTAELVAAKGDEHEESRLEQMREAHGDALVEIETGPTHVDLVRATEQTRLAMEAGAPVICQATFRKDGWRGHADFLERVDQPSDLGVELRGRRHQARALGQALLRDPAVPVLGVRGRNPGARAGRNACGPRDRRAQESRAGRLRRLLPPDEAPLLRAA